MKICKPEIEEINGSIHVSARVETTSCPVSLPEKLWFSFPRQFCDHITGDVNGFATALLPLAMILGEDLHMEGSLSPRLLGGLEEYQRIQCAWDPSPFQPVRLIPESLQAGHAGHTPTAVGTSFSGGIDSFHTLWSHLSENERNPSYSISHALIINGFDRDSDLGKPGNFSMIEQVMQPMMERLGIQFIVCRTNYMSFSDAFILKQTFGAMVTSPALVLGGLFSAFYIPSSYRFDDFFRDGSHPMLDHLVATETMQTIHEGSHLKRTQKTRDISQWSETYSTLRVCSRETGYDEETNSIQNCCRCEKCIRTIKTLELYGALDNYKTFAERPGRFDVWSCHFAQKGTRIFAWEIIDEAFKARRFKIVIDYCIALATTAIGKYPKAIFRKIHFFLAGHSEKYERQVLRFMPHLADKINPIKK